MNLRAIVNLQSRELNVTQEHSLDSARLFLVFVKRRELDESLIVLPAPLVLLEGDRAHTFASFGVSVKVSVYEVISRLSRH